MAPKIVAAPPPVKKGGGRPQVTPETMEKEKSKQERRKAAKAQAAAAEAAKPAAPYSPPAPANSPTKPKRKAKTPVPEPEPVADDDEGGEGDGQGDEKDASDVEMDDDNGRPGPGAGSAGKGRHEKSAYDVIESTLGFRADLSSVVSFNVGSLEVVLRGIITELSRQKEAVGQLSEENATLRAEVDELRSVERDDSRAEERLHVLEQDLKETRTTVFDTHVKLGGIVEENEALKASQSDMSKLKRDVAKLSGGAQAAEKEVAAVKKSLQTTESLVRKLEYKLHQQHRATTAVGQPRADAADGDASRSASRLSNASSEYEVVDFGDSEMDGAAASAGGDEASVSGSAPSSKPTTADGRSRVASSQGGALSPAVGDSASDALRRALSPVPAVGGASSGGSGAPAQMSLDAIEAIARVADENRTMSARIESLEEELGSLRTHVDAPFADLKAKVGAVEEETQQILAQVSAVDGNLRSRLQALESESSQRQTDSSEAERYVLDRLQRLEELTQEVSAVTQRTAQKAVEHRVFLDTKNSILEQIDRDRRAQTALNTRVQQMIKEVSTLRATVSGAQNPLESQMFDRIDKLKNRVTDMQQRVDALGESKADVAAVELTVQEATKQAMEYSHSVCSQLNDKVVMLVERSDAEAGQLKQLLDGQRRLRTLVTNKADAAELERFRKDLGMDAETAQQAAAHRRPLVPMQNCLSCDKAIEGHQARSFPSIPAPSPMSKSFDGSFNAHLARGRHALARGPAKGIGSDPPPMHASGRDPSPRRPVTTDGPARAKKPSNSYSMDFAVADRS